MSFSYRKARTELDKIIEQLESGELDIDAATKLHQRGMELLNELQTYLKTAENTVKKIKADFDKTS